MEHEDDNKWGSRDKGTYRLLDRNDPRISLSNIPSAVNQSTEESAAEKKVVERNEDSLPEPTTFGNLKAVGKMEAPDRVTAGEQFNVTYVYEGEDKVDDYDFSPGDFKLIWGPQKGNSTAIQLEAGKRRAIHSQTYTYILLSNDPGRHIIPSVRVRVGGKDYASPPKVITVVSNE